MSELLERQNQVIIELLARMSIGAEKIGEIVRKNKQNPESYVKVYNQLNGSKTLTDLAKDAGLTKQALSPILTSWEDQGIVYNIGSEKLPKYVGLLKLPLNVKNSSQPKKTSKKKNKEREEFVSNIMGLPTDSIVEQTATDVIDSSEDLVEGKG